MSAVRAELRVTWRAHSGYRIGGPRVERRIVVEGAAGPARGERVRHRAGNEGDRSAAQVAAAKAETAIMRRTGTDKVDGE